MRAAALPAAMADGADAGVVVEAALRVARDGTRQAIEAVCERAARCSDWREAIPALREAVEPFDTAGPAYRNPGLGARRPSRLHSIEELPVALGLLVVARGGYRDAVLGGVNYGRDSDSIASMAGALAGALGGVESIPAEWRRAVGDASRIDIEAPGRVMAGVAREIFEADELMNRRRRSAFQRLAEALNNAPDLGPA